MACKQVSLMKLYKHNAGTVNVALPVYLDSHFPIWHTSTTWLALPFD